MSVYEGKLSNGNVQIVEAPYGKDGSGAAPVIKKGKDLRTGKGK